MLAGRRMTDVVVAAVQGGVTMVQLREKTAATRGFLELARALRALLTPLAVPLLINDRLDIALAAGADGVHVGQDDMPVAALRQWLGPRALIGLSITDLAQVAGDDVAQADYLGVGPIFPQSTKRDAAPVMGLEGLSAVRSAVTKPIIAIGGVAKANAAEVRAAGADGLAVVSAIMAAADPCQAAAELMAAFRND
jgi:thiamine-phosphate pyrophosphorylase